MLSGLGGAKSGTASIAGAAPRRLGLVIGSMLGLGAIALAFWWQNGSSDTAADTAQSVAVVPKGLSGAQPSASEAVRPVTPELPASPASTVAASAPARIEVVDDPRTASGTVLGHRIRDGDSGCAGIRGVDGSSCGV